ncbi:MAG: prepilin-type N-terminal cleavage/methylation domain-containing protein [Planctomycetota bacterium]
MGTNQSMRLARRPAGFSLMELLLVILILGIIAAIIVPRVSVSTEAARTKVRESQITQMNSMIEQYQIENDAAPTDLTDLVPNYLPDGLPTDPSGGTYSLNSTTDRVEYTP